MPDTSINNLWRLGFFESSGLSMGVLKTLATTGCSTIGGCVWLGVAESCLVLSACGEGIYYEQLL